MSVRVLPGTVNTKDHGARYLDRENSEALAYGLLPPIEWASSS